MSHLARMPLIKRAKVLSFRQEVTPPSLRILADTEISSTSLFPLIPLSVVKTPPKEVRAKRILILERIPETRFPALVGKQSLVLRSLLVRRKPPLPLQLEDLRPLSSILSPTVLPRSPKLKRSKAGLETFRRHLL